MLAIEQLRSGYRDGIVLNGVDLTIEAGGVMALLGRNGMGKTTLLRTVVGQVPVRAGAIRFAGQRIDGRPSYEISNLGIGYVPQGRQIFGDFTVEENLILGTLGRPGLSPAIPESLYAHFPILQERRRQRAGTLSGGEQQQLALARALIGRPRLLLLDEPSEGIQPNIVELITEILSEIVRAEGLSMLIVEQNVEMALSLADHCCVIENGQIAARMTGAQARADRDGLYAHLSI